MCRLSAKSLRQCTLRKVYPSLLSLGGLTPFEQVRIIYTKPFKSPNSKDHGKFHSVSRRAVLCAFQHSLRLILRLFFTGFEVAISILLKEEIPEPEALSPNPYLSNLCEEFSGCLWLNYSIIKFVLKSTVCLRVVSELTSCGCWLWCQLLAPFSPLSHSIAHQVHGFLSSKVYLSYCRWQWLG